MLATPLVRVLAIRIGALARPVGRSVHRRPVPYLGGLAIFIGFLVATWFSLGMDDPQLRAILAGGLIILIVGVVDDLTTLPAWAKLAGQFLAAGVGVALGLRVEWLTNPLGGMFYLGNWGIGPTIIWIVAVVNVVNLVDGLDGLAAGISAIVACTLLFAALQAGQTMVAVMAAALAGSSLGFLPYNFNPARIFMGDAGSMFLGYALATIAVVGTFKSATAAALAVPVVALAIPIADTSFAIVRRYRGRRPVHEADDGHIHHRLLQRGLTQRQAVVLLYSISACFGATAVMLTTVLRLEALLLLAVLVAALLIGGRGLGVLTTGGRHPDLPA